VRGNGLFTIAFKSSRGIRYLLLLLVLRKKQLLLPPQNGISKARYAMKLMS
jgi:hypothetical protein